MFGLCVVVLKGIKHKAVCANLGMKEFNNFTTDL